MQNKKYFNSPPCKRLYQSLQKKSANPNSAQMKRNRDIHAVDVMDLHAKDKFYNDPNGGADATNIMMMRSAIQAYDPLISLGREDDVPPQELFMMYATQSEDGSCTTAVAIAGVSNTNSNSPAQFRTKQPRNIITNSTQSMFDATQRYWSLTKIIKLTK